MTLLTFDFETTNLDKGDPNNPENRILMVAWKLDDGPVKIFSGSIYDAQEFHDDLKRADTLLAHNAKFEMGWLLRLGYNITRWQWHDTMLAQRILAGNRPWPMGLGAISEAHGLPGKDPVIDSMMKAGMCPSEMPQERLKARNVLDVDNTYHLWTYKFRPALEIREMLHLYRTRTQLAVILAEMERNGMYLDRYRTWDTYREYAAEQARTAIQLDELTGGINLRSPDQLATYLYGTLKFPERTDAKGKPIRNKPSKQFPNGRPKTDKDTLAWLAKKAETSEQKRFVELRQKYGRLNSALTKTLEFFKGVVDEYAEHFRAQFNQTVAATHRLTSSGKPLTFKQFDRPKSAQLQNMAREFKRLFRAPSNEFEVVEVDAAQIEFRVAAFVGQDQQAMADIQDPDFDAHCTSASVMNQIPYDEFLAAYRAGDPKYKEMRRIAKVDTFKPLYGGSKGTEAQERWYKEFQNRYSGIYNVQENWVAEVARTGCLTTPWGMKFYYDGEFNRRGVLIDKHTKRPLKPLIFNHPIQELATAEIVPIAIIMLHGACVKEKLRVTFCNTIHDSVVAYVHRDDLARYKELARHAFTAGVREYLKLIYNVHFNVPLGCGITVGRYWGEGEEEIFDEVGESNV